MNNNSFSGGGQQPNVIVLGGAGPGPANTYRPTEVPPRVQQAMRLLELLTVKASVHMAAKMDSHDGFDQGEGQELSDQEKSAQNAALKVVGEYFSGDLKPGVWDKPLRRAKEDRETLGLNLIKMDCPKCGGNQPAKQFCSVCRGHGAMAICQLSGEEVG